MKFSELLKEKIQDEPLYKVCKRFGIAQAKAYKIINGEYDENISPLIAARLCIIFDIDPKDLKEFDFNPSDSFINAVEKIYSDIMNPAHVDNSRFSKNELKKSLINNGYILDNSWDVPAVIQFSSNINDAIFAYTATKEKNDLIVFDLPTRKMYSNSSSDYPDHNIRDFSNLFLLINSKNYKFKTMSDYQALSSISDSFNKFASKFKTCSNFVFYTRSKELYDRISFFEFDSLNNKNIQLIYCSYPKKTKTKVIMGKQFINI